MKYFRNKKIIQRRIKEISLNLLFPAKKIVPEDILTKYYRSQPKINKPKPEGYNGFYSHSSGIGDCLVGSAVIESAVKQKTQQLKVK